MKVRGWLIVMIGGLMVVGCSDPLADAKRQFEIVKRNGATRDEICAAHRKLVQAYLDAGDEKGYAFEKMLSDGDCMSADINRRLGTM